MSEAQLRRGRGRGRGRSRRSPRMMREEEAASSAALSVADAGCGGGGGGGDMNGWSRSSEPGGGTLRDCGGCEVGAVGCVVDRSLLGKPYAHAAVSAEPMSLSGEEGAVSLSPLDMMACMMGCEQQLRSNSPRSWVSGILWKSSTGEGACWLMMSVCVCQVCVCV